MALSKVDLANQVENQLPQNLVANNVNFRNIIINGDMSIAQRATSTSSITGNGYHTVDRFQTVASSLGTWTQSQSTDVPSGQGFSTSLKMDCTTADAAPSASDQLQIRQKVEGQNLQYLKKGTSSAESTTVSFWIKATKTGTNIVELFDNDNSRQICKSFTISSSDTWEKKTLTFAGDTTGAFGNDNGASLFLVFWLGCGSNFNSGTLSTSWESGTNANKAVGQVNHADSTANNWYITGVQLEAGTTASDFEFVPYDINYHRCKRYYQEPYANSIGSTNNYGYIFNVYSTANAYTQWVFNPEMRTAPTMTAGSPISSSGLRFYSSAAERTITGMTFDSTSSQSTNPNIAGTFARAGDCGHVNSTNNAELFKADAEL